MGFKYWVTASEAPPAPVWKLKPSSSRPLAAMVSARVHHIDVQQRGARDLLLKADSVPFGAVRILYEVMPGRAVRVHRIQRRAQGQLALHLLTERPEGIDIVLPLAQRRRRPERHAEQRAALGRQGLPCLPAQLAGGQHRAAHARAMLLIWSMTRPSRYSTVATTCSPMRAGWGTPVRRWAMSLSASMG